jgi:pimeloyl-ACP methyl ester carboxylesterase
VWPRLNWRPMYRQACARLLLEFRRSAKGASQDRNPTGLGRLDRLVDPNPFPGWLTEADLDCFVSQFRSNGFGGPASLSQLRTRFRRPCGVDGKLITHPTAFMAGSLEPVFRMISGVDMVELIRKHCADLRYVRLMEDAGHWLQQERPAEVTVALLEFLRGLQAT